MPWTWSLARDLYVLEGNKEGYKRGIHTKVLEGTSGIKESYSCLRGALHDGQVGLRCNHVLRQISWYLSIKSGQFSFW